jgi:hypothetical protein
MVCLMSSQLEDEIESWKGLPWALRKEERELWDEMIKEVSQRYARATGRRKGEAEEEVNVAGHKVLGGPVVYYARK